MSVQSCAVASSIGLLAEGHGLDRLLDGVDLELAHLRERLGGILVRPGVLELLDEERIGEGVPRRPWASGCCPG